MLDNSHLISDLMFNQVSNLILLAVSISINFNERNSSIVFADIQLHGGLQVTVPKPTTVLTYPR